MEKPLDKHMEDVMHKPGVTGVLCSDSQGLCFGAKGIAKKNVSGLVSSVSHQAAQLNPDSKELPVICIESDAGSVVIKSHDSVTLAVYKNSS